MTSVSVSNNADGMQFGIRLTSDFIFGKLDSLVLIQLNILYSIDELEQLNRECFSFTSLNNSGATDIVM